MYDKHLNTFIIVANSGSFLKASDKLYISANAVTKQINLLEADLGLKLFLRSPQGLILTESGKLIYDEAKMMIMHSDLIIQNAKEIENQQGYTIRVGISLMNPAGILLEQWDKISSLYPTTKIDIVPFEDSVPAFNDVLDHLGSKIHIVSCPYQNRYWDSRYHTFHIKDIPVSLACSRKHKLSKRKLLSITDLYGETIIMKNQGTSDRFDAIYEALKQHPQIHIEEVPYYDYAFFNHLVSSDKLAISCECWTNVHPLLATVSVDWEFTIPYGLIYSKEPSKQVLEFIMAIGKTQ